MEKYIKDVFKDFDVSGANRIIEAQIQNINLYKKTNKLQVDIVSENQITIDEIGKFENYLQDRFNVNKALINVKYDNVQIEPKIEENWKNIISYITAKEPFSKAILTNSEVQVNDKKLQVSLKIKGSAFLCSKKFDKGLEHLLYNLYNDNFEVEIKDDLDESYFENLEKTFEQEEKRAVEQTQKDALENVRRAQMSQDAAIEAEIAAQMASMRW